VKNIREALGKPAALGYHHLGDKRQPAQLALKEAKILLSDIVPPGYSVRNSGVAQNLPHIPWIAILDDDQTETTQEGIFLVYLYSSDLKTIYLSLNQGFTRHRVRASKQSKIERGGGIQAAALASIRSETTAFKSSLKLAISNLPNSVSTIDLKSDVELAEGYEAGHMTGFAYNTSSLPSNETMLRDLESLYALYEEACVFADKSLLLNPETWTSTSGKNEYKRRRVHTPGKLNFNDFAPREFSNVLMKPQTITHGVRSRKHEELISNFADYVRPLGFSLSNRNIGKRDLVMKSSTGMEYLVEAKTVNLDGESAVRDAIGQLFAYRYEYYPKDSYPQLVALFNLPIDGFWQSLLEELSVHWVFKKEGEWFASSGLELVGRPRRGQSADT
jgi:hypothetical protein